MATDITLVQAIGHPWRDVLRALEAMSAEMDVRQVVSVRPESGADDLVVTLRLVARRRLGGR